MKLLYKFIQRFLKPTYPTEVYTEATIHLNYTEGEEAVSLQEPLTHDPVKASLYLQQIKNKLEEDPPQA